MESIIRFVTDSPSNMQYVEDICNKDVMFISSNDGECDGVQFFVDVNEQIYELFEKYKHYDDVESILGRSSEIRIGVGNSYFIVLRPTDIDMAVVRRGVKCLRERGWLPFNCEKSFIVSALEDEVLTKAFNAVYDTKNRTTEHLTMFNCDILPSLLRRGKFKICPLDSERQIAKFNLLTGQSMNDKKNLVVVNYEFLKNVKE